MSLLSSILLAVQMISAIVMVGLILIQHGKGADMGAAFGGGSSGSLFGASGSANFLSRSTAVLATVFFVCTLALAYLGNVRPAGSGSVLERTPASAPATPAQQIPGTTPQPVPGGAAPQGAPAGTAPQGAAGGASSIPAPAAGAASGAGQIPAR